MTHPESIRKAAILVSLLDARSADAILDPMDEELSAQVRQAVMELDDVSPEEQESVLADFLGRGSNCDPADGGVELQLTAHPPSSLLSMDSAPPFSFLSDVAPKLLADLLACELPQTVAVVVAHLPAEQAGQVLERLPPGLATEALSRMAWLTALLPDVLADLEAELRRRLLPHGRTSARGLAGVRAILETLPGQTRAELLDRLAREDERLVRGLKARRPESGSPASDAAEVNSQIHRFPTSEPQVFHHQRSAAASAPLLEFEDLSLLSDGDLARLAAAASVQTLALALVEADERLTRRILQVLARSDAADLRRRLKLPGPIRLNEIDQAQRQLAELARQLAHRGQITISASRHFAAAA